MKKIAKLTTLFAPALAVIQGCSPTAPAASSVKHDLGHPTRTTSGWNWVAATDDQYENAIAPLFGINAADILPSDSKLTQRIQFWVDKVDAALRADHAQELAGVPKPKAKVIMEKTPNAFIAPAPVCYSVPVKLRSGNPTAANTRDRAIIDPSTGELSDFAAADYECIEATGSASVKTFAQDFNAASPDCKFNVTGSGASTTLVPNSACRISDDLGADTVLAKKVVLLQTASFVTVHTGIFGIMDEAAFVAVLAHELGHYYRSHVTAHESAFGYYYTLDVSNPDHRPTAEAAMKDYGDKAFAAATLLSGNDYYNLVPDQKHRSELFFATGSLVASVGAASNAPAECKSAATFFKTEGFVTDIDVFPFVGDNNELNNAYKAFETKARACLAKLTVKASGGVSPSGASWAAFKDLITAPEWPTWLFSLPPSTARQIGALLAVIDSRVGDAPAVGTKWDKVIEVLSQRFADQDAAGILALKTAHEKHVGQYTAEQEADEEAAEWIAKLGFNPGASVDAMHALAIGEPTGLHGMSLGQADCEELWANDWLKDGVYQFVPVGDFSEVHHSTCYRMFNLEREIAAHQQASSGATLPEHGGQLWKDLQTAASDAEGGDDAPPVSHGPLGFRKLSKVAKMSKASDCIWANSYR